MPPFRLPLPTKPPKTLRTTKDRLRAHRPTSRDLLQDACDDPVHPSHPGATRSVTHASVRP